VRQVDWLVLLSGVAAIAWVNWYFFLAQRATATASASDGRQDVEVTVRGGYDPGVIRLKRGVPARIVFDRQETSACSEEIVIPAFGVRRFLAPFKKTPVDFTPTESGKFDMTCGMSMLHGTLLVE
jgi:plastocyanin domain-containing protein